MSTDCARRPDLALINCTVIDGTGAAPHRAQTVLIRGGVIAGRGTGLTIPGGYDRVDLAGAFVLPGLINAHVHDAYDDRNLRSWLEAGVTTVRDLNHHGVSDFLAFRDRVNADPNLAQCVSSSPIITKTGGYGSLFVDSAEEARNATVRQIEDGVDLIKIAVEDHLQGRHFPMLTAEEVRAIVDAAHARGVRVVAHISHVRNLGPALDAGVDEIAHMVVEPLPDDLIARMVAQNVYFTPTLELWRGVSRAHSIDWDTRTIDNLARFHKKGGQVALGTDFGGYFTEFDRGLPRTEIALMQRAGLTNMDIIVSATLNGAYVCGLADRLGTVEPGKSADLMAVAGNPLEDMGALERPVMVVRSGNVVVDRRTP